MTTDSTSNMKMTFFKQYFGLYLVQVLGGGGGKKKYWSFRNFSFPKQRIKKGYGTGSVTLTPKRNIVEFQDLQTDIFNTILNNF